MSDASLQPTEMQSGSSTGTSAIVAENLGKCYQIYDKPIHRVYDMLLPGTKRRCPLVAIG